MSRRLLVCAALMAAALVIALLSPAHAAVRHPEVVHRNADDHIPQLVPTESIPRPRVDAIAIAGDTVYAGGLFDAVKQGGLTYTGLSNIVAFDMDTGKVDTSFRPRLSGGSVQALAADAATGDVFVGGHFDRVNGVERVGLVKLDGATGGTVGAFSPYFRVGKVWDLELADLGGRQRLLVAGGMSGKLRSVDPHSGRLDGFITATFANKLPGSAGGVIVQWVAVSPDGSRLVATGNFTTVDGKPRSRFVMMDLAGGSGATVASWYYPGFAKACSSTDPRKIAYLQGVDWSPDGQAFTVVATGQIPKERPAEVYHEWYSDEQKAQTTVCDGVGRFSLDDPTKPLWINYTGGDSVWSVADTGAAVYVQGHFKWLDNPDGYSSQGIGDTTTGEPAVRAGGIGAIDPTTGKAISTWTPWVPARAGGKALLATPDGLLVGNDAARFGHEAHYGLAFAPLRR